MNRAKIESGDNYITVARAFAIAMLRFGLPASLVARNKLSPKSQQFLAIFSVDLVGDHISDHISDHKI